MWNRPIFKITRHPPIVKSLYRRIDRGRTELFPLKFRPLLIGKICGSCKKVLCLYAAKKRKCTN